MKKVNFTLLFFLGITIILVSFFSVSLMATEKKPSDETNMVNNKEISKEYINDLHERTGDLGESIRENLNGTKYQLSGILSIAERFPAQVIYLVPIKETTLKEKQNIKSKIYNIIKSENFSNKETFEIVFEEN